VDAEDLNSLGNESARDANAGGNSISGTIAKHFRDKTFPRMAEEDWTAKLVESPDILKER